MTQNSNHQSGYTESAVPFDSDYCELCDCYLDGDFHVRAELFPQICDECGEDVELPSISDEATDVS